LDVAKDGLLLEELNLARIDYHFPGSGEFRRRSEQINESHCEGTKKDNTHNRELTLNNSDRALERVDERRSNLGRTLA
jgi:hypothetical protein